MGLGGDRAARGKHEIMRHMPLACMKSAENVETVARPWSAAYSCIACDDHRSAQRQKTAPARQPSSGDAPNDPHEPVHHPGMGHRLRGRACGGPLPPRGPAAHPSEHQH
eukprot:899993-Prymnesium_polylepis.2